MKKSIAKYDEEKGTLTFSCRGTEHELMFDKPEVGLFLNGREVLEVGNGPADYLFLKMDKDESVLVPYQHVMYYLRRDEKKS